MVSVVKICVFKSLVLLLVVDLGSRSGFSLLLLGGISVIWYYQFEVMENFCFSIVFVFFPWGFPFCLLGK